MLVTTVLFLGGAAFGYIAIFPLMFLFFTSFDSDIVQSAWTMSEVFSLTTHMFLAFGVAFELPVVVFFLALAGIVDAPKLLRGTPYAVLIIFIAAAILTPTPDWVSQVLLGVPMVGLYLLGVGVAFVFTGVSQDGARSQAGERQQPHALGLTRMGRGARGQRACAERLRRTASPARPSSRAGPCRARGSRLATRKPMLTPSIVGSTLLGDDAAR